MPQANYSLRNVVGAITVAVTAMSLAVCLALIMLTTHMHAVNADLGVALRSVRGAEQAQLDLLLVGRADTPIVRHELEADVRRRLERLRDYVTSDREAIALAEAETSVGAYVHALETPASAEERDALLDSAFSAMAEVVDINLRDARASHAAAERWNDFADVLGWTLGGSVLVLAGVLVWWLRYRALAPMLEIGEVMERFGQGDHAARAPLAGPTEARAIALRLNEMADAIAHQDRAQLSAVAAMVHEVRNPLFGLRLALVNARRGDAEARESAIAIAQRQIEQLERMVCDFLDVARLRAGELDLRLETCDLVAIVRDSVASLHGSSSRHEIIIDAPPTGSVATKCDPMRIQQVTTNLVGNAIKYSPDGGVIQVRVRDDGTTARIEVIDEGIGIAPQDRDRLFDPFERVVGGDAPPREGFGLGLFIVQRIVHAHGGTVSVDSEAGRGSRFVVALPKPTPA